ncbi:MAG: cupin domain-containing protein [Phycisphaerales bacterium]
MPVIPNNSRDVFHLPGAGLNHQTLASALDGLTGTECWRQTLAPRAATPIHYHECEEVVVILAGTGRVTLGDDVIDFAADVTLIVPAHVVHQIVNTGPSPLQLIACFNATPAHAFAPDGKAIPLPWDVL